MAIFTSEVIATGPLTDAELRATPVPISGTVTTSGLTDAQLRATPVPVSGTVTATGPLTDAQLRATPVPVSGTVTATGPLTDAQLRATPVPTTEGAKTTAVVTAVTVSTTVATVLTSLASRSKFILYNEAGTLFVKLGTSATASDYSMRLTANTSWEFSGYSGVVTAIKSAGTTNLQATSVQ